MRRNETAVQNAFCLVEARVRFPAARRGSRRRPPVDADRRRNGDAVGPVITSTTALGQSGTTFLNAVLAGNPGAAMAALRDAAPSVGSAFLYGHNTVSVPLPSDISGVSVALNIPFGGALAAVQPLTVTVTFGGDLPDLAPVTVPFPMQVGGIVPEVQANGPSVALALLLLPLFFL
jgi:hypothetical protein